MHRFYLPPDRARGSRLELADAEAKHAAKVLRLRPGDSATVLDGEGNVIQCTVAEASRSRVVLDTNSRLASPAPNWQVTLLQAVTKGRGFEDIIEKATELGVNRIVPLLTERTVPKPGSDVAQKLEKWQHVAIEAIKQCGNPWLPKIAAPLTPNQWLAQGDTADLRLISSLQPASRHPRVFFEEFVRKRGALPRSVSVWVGPEGDFTPAETEAAVAAGVLPITLGPLVLRVETAAVACLAVINHELSWPRPSTVAQASSPASSGSVSLPRDSVGLF